MAQDSSINQSNPEVDIQPSKKKKGLLKKFGVGALIFFTVKGCITLSLILFGANWIYLKFFSSDKVKDDIVYLTDDALEGRETGTDAEKTCADYLKMRFEELDLEAAGENGTFFQDFSFKPHPPVGVHGDSTDIQLGMSPVIEVTGRNVIAKVDNESSRYIIIGAHYDHLGWGNQFSLHRGDSAVHNGADDNASGVAAMLEIARRISRLDLKSNILFMAFSGEEMGIYGSNYFCDNPTIPLDSVDYMLNFDMVGRMKEDNSLALYGSGTSPVWTEISTNVNEDSLKLIYSESGVGPSDHTSFYLEDIPVLHFFTGQHEDYHKPTDDEEFLNYDGIYFIIDYVERMVEAMDEKLPIEFTKTKDQDSESTPSFKVTLGVIPDYMFDDKGMRMDGVTDGKPASNAGMIKGDIVLKLGEYEVNDIYEYMDGLSKFSPGDTTIVKVQRENEVIDLEVIWD